MSRVFSVYFDGVHDDVLSHGRVEADLADCAVEFPVTEAVASESDGRARMDATEICIFVRSLAMRKRLGALKLATTVCPTFTRRSMITPLTGDLMVQKSRFRCAFLREASAWSVAALDCVIAASPTATLAFATS